MTTEMAREIISCEIERFESKSKSREFIQGIVIGMVNGFKAMGIEISNSTIQELLDEIC